MKKIISLILILVLSAGFLISCGGTNNGDGTPVTPPTNDEMIAARISAFTSAYNSGDWDKMTGSLDSKTRKTFNALMNLVGGIIDLDLRDLFSLSINLTGTQFAKLDIVNIEYTSEVDAIVTTESFVYGQTILYYFVMVKENGGWYIQDMTDKKPEADSGTDGKNKISSPAIHDFDDGIALVREGTLFATYWAVINTEGETIFETAYGKESGLYDHSFSTIGGGVGCSIKTYMDMSKVYEIINSQGEVISSSRDGEYDEVIAFGDGYAVVHKCEASISSIDHKYGIIDNTGSFKIPMTSVGEEEIYYEISYVGEGVFHIPGQALINAELGKIMYVNFHLDKSFKNGSIYTYDTWGEDRIFTEGEDEIILPKNYILHSDGSFTPLADCISDYTTSNDDTLVFEYEGRYYIANAHDFTEDGEVLNYHILEEFASNQASGFEFCGNEYALLEIRGFDEQKYITLIDKEANLLFEPVCIGDYYYASIEYSEGMIICNYGNTCFVLNESGETVISADNGFKEIHTFNGGIAAAITTDGNAVYIDKSGNIIIDEFYKK